MASTVKSRPNHYEMLGLKPSATDDEIARAFAREISIFRPHTVSGVADVTVAYEVLRNPAKRRAYDDSLGLNPPPKAPPSLSLSGVGGASFLLTGGLVPGSGERPAPGSPTVEDAVEAAAIAPAPPEPVPAARSHPIGEALRELARPAPLPDPVARETPPPARPPTAPPETDARPAVPEPVHLTLGEPQGEDEETGAPPWKRAGIAAGALGLVAVLGGAWAGWNSGATAPRQAEGAAMLTPPPSTTFTAADPAANAPDRVLDAARPPQPRRAVRSAKRVAHARRTSPLAGLDQQYAAPSTPSPAPADASAQVAAAAPAAVPASMPLSNGAIARTISRIGYPCGSVASTRQILGGVFTVTCTSGHTYRAAPVRGRYHFRRVSGQTP